MGYEEREAVQERFSIRGARGSTAKLELAQAVRGGLRAVPKHLPCRFFYDDVGSRLFEEICELPEYYLTRAEDEILERHAAEIVARVPSDSSLVELGSGSARKTRHLINAFLRRAPALCYTPIDISPRMLEESSRALVEEYPALTIRAVAAEYQDALDMLRSHGSGPKLVLWLGSNVGNFDRPSAADFLRRVGRSLGALDRIVLGIDLRKSKGVLERAYDDASGVTARFNLNLLARINAELGADFDLARFRHRARYDEAEGRVAMSVESRIAQRVRIGDLGLRVSFGAGESIHTEDSFKYSLSEIETLAAAAGMAIERLWTDSAKRFSVSVMQPLAPRPGPGG